MELVELSEKKFEQFASKHKYATFYQTKEWAKLKSINGWKHYYVGLLNNSKKIVGATLLLEKTTPVKKSMFYAPRGFLIDYDDSDLLLEFTKKIKEYVKSKKGIFIKLDPTVIYRQRDINGDIVVNGIDNRELINTMKKIGYKHYGLSLSSHVGLQPRWVFVLPLENKEIEDVTSSFNSRTKRSIKKCESRGVIVEKINKEQLDIFKSIMEHTSSRRGFIDRPFSYYQELFNNLGEHCKVYISYLDTKLAKELLEKEIESQKQRIVELGRNKESKKYEENEAKCKKTIEEKTIEIEKIKKLEIDNGNKIPLGGAMFLHFEKETTYLFGGSFQEFMEYPSQYLIQYTAIKEALDLGCDVFNFYGIDGYIKEQGEMHGVYEFKKGFGGEVREYIGEFDLVISKFYYILYKVAFAIYHKLKNLKR